MSNRKAFLIAIVVAFALFAAACSGDDPELVGAEDPGEEPEPASESADDDVEQPSEEEPRVDTGPVEPLTGLALEDPALLGQPAIAVKIDNSPDARPQVGINQADQVVEVLVEGITRLVAVFHSTGADPVGPVRSGRSSDPDIAANYNAPLYAWSGGNAIVRTEVRNAELAGKLYDVGVDQSPGDYYREGSPRFAPHNLFSTTEALLALQPEGASGPEQMFDYRAAGEALVAGAEEVRGIRILWRGGLEVHYVWDADRGGWVRFQRGTPHVDGDDVVAAPPNVVILFTPYQPSTADSISPQAISVGSGEALTLTDGSAITGTWTRPDALEPWAVVDDAGDPVRLTPGRTWIGLPETGDVTFLTDAEADSLLALAG